MAKGDKKKGWTKKRDRVHLVADGIPILATLVLANEGDAAEGGDSALTKLGYAADAVDLGDWSSPTGVVANVGYAFDALAGNILTTDGLLLEGLALGARHLLKNSSYARHTFWKTKHHSIGI